MAVASADSGRPEYPYILAEVRIPKSIIGSQLRLATHHQRQVNGRSMVKGTHELARGWGTACSSSAPHLMGNMDSFAPGSLQLPPSPFRARASQKGTSKAGRGSIPCHCPIQPTSLLLKRGAKVLTMQPCSVMHRLELLSRNMGAGQNKHPFPQKGDSPAPHMKRFCHPNVLNLNMNQHDNLFFSLFNMNQH